MHPLFSSGCSDFPDMYDEAEARLIFGSHPLSTTRSTFIFCFKPALVDMTSLNLIQTLLLHCCPRIYLSRIGLLLVLALFAEDAGTPADLRYVPSASLHSPLLALLPLKDKLLNPCPFVLG